MIKKVPILRVVGSETSEIEDTLVTEHTATVLLNNREVVTLLCSPIKLDYLAIGFLLGEGYIKSREDVLKATVSSDQQSSTVHIEARASGELAVSAAASRLIASSGSKTLTSKTVDSGQPGRIISQIKITPTEIRALMERFHHHSPVFEATGGVHSVALCDHQQIIAFSDDIGRHNAMDRVFGECLMKGIDVTNRIVITSGRVSSEILNKVARRGVPVIMSVSAPTDMAVGLADSFGITLIGFIRGNKMNIYTHRGRVVLNGK